MAEQITRTLANRGPNIILYVDRDQYMPATTNSHYWCFDYLRPFLSFYLAQHEFDVSYLEWYDGPQAYMPSVIENQFIHPSGCVKSASARAYDVKCFHRSDGRTLFLATTREDLDVAQRLMKGAEILSFTGPSSD